MARGSAHSSDGNAGQSLEAPPPRLPEMRRHHNSRAEACFNEAYVTLGRLNYVKTRHDEDAERMLALLEERVGGAFEAAQARVHGEFEGLRNNLEKLFRKSLADLERHKMALEAPTRARVELIKGQQATAENTERRLKAVMDNPDKNRVLRELPELSRGVNRVLKSSVKLIGIHFPEATSITAEDFPLGRLHNLVIAPKRSGDRSFRAPPSSLEASSFEDIAGASAAEMAASDRQGKGKKDWKGDGAGCCRGAHNNARRPTAGCIDRRHSIDGAGNTSATEDDAMRDAQVGRKGNEACSHCACACQADDVWTAYRTLRTRYNALKDQADVEEVRVRVEECRRELQKEFEERSEALEDELRHERMEMKNGNERDQAEVQVLRGMVEKSEHDFQAAQEESDMLREKVLLGEQRLQEALREALYAREEIGHREEHGRMLLARIRFLKQRTAAHVQNNATSAAADVDYIDDEELEFLKGAGIVPDSDDDGDDDDGPDSRPSHPNLAQWYYTSSEGSDTEDHQTPRSSATKGGNDGLSRAAPVPGSRYNALPPNTVYDDQGTDSDFSSQSGFGSENGSKIGSDEVSREREWRRRRRGDARRGEAGSYGEEEAVWEDEGEQGRGGMAAHQEHYLQRDGEHLTREVKDLSSRLAASGLRLDSAASFSDDESSTYATSNAPTPRDANGSADPEAETAAQQRNPSTSHPTAGTATAGVQRSARDTRRQAGKQHGLHRRRRRGSGGEVKSAQEVNYVVDMDSQRRHRRHRRRQSQREVTGRPSASLTSSESESEPEPESESELDSEPIPFDGLSSRPGGGGSRSDDSDMVLCYNSASSGSGIS